MNIKKKAVGLHLAPTASCSSAFWNPVLTHNGSGLMGKPLHLFEDESYPVLWVRINGPLHVALAPRQALQFPTCCPRRGLRG